MSTWGGHWTAGIGAATADSPEGPFVDQGKIFDSKSIGVENSIDQTYFDNGKKKYMLWGSFHGIYAVELTKDGLAVKKGADKVKIAGTAYEGAYIYKKGKYYYFFGSTGSCCEGLNSTYQLVYGRSKSLLGPYVNKKGDLLMNNKHDVLIGKNEGFVGNGHNAQILKDDAGNDWLFYHGFVNEDNSKKLDRYLLLSQLKWDQQGWPYVDGNSPQKTANAPFIR